HLRHHLRRAGDGHPGHGHLDVLQRLPVLPSRLRHRDRGRHHARGDRRRDPVRALTDPGARPMTSLSSASVPQPVAALPDTTVAVPEPRENPRRRGGVIGTVVLAIAALVWISPLLLLLVTSFRPLADCIAH